MDYKMKLYELKGYLIKGLICGGILGLIPAGLVGCAMFVTGERSLGAIGALLFFYVLSAFYFSGIPYGWHLINEKFGNRFIVASPIFMLAVYSFKFCIAMVSGLTLYGKMFTLFIKARLSNS